MKKVQVSKFICTLLTVFSLSSCTWMGGATGNSVEEDTSEVVKTILPDYDSITADEMVLTGWYTPKVSLESFQTYKDCGFNYIFLQGRNVGSATSPLTEQALQLCDELDLHAFVDITQAEDLLLPAADILSKYESFKGFCFDEPVIYKNTLNNRLGVFELSPYVEALRMKQPNVEFLVNLNPTAAVGYPWGTPSFTYAEYLDAQQTYINALYKDSECMNWISCDDYPLCYNTSAKKKYYLKAAWLQNLEYLANEKRDSDIPLTSNFFIQSMPLGTDKNRVPTYEDLSLQMYSCMAYGYDSISFFCYDTPPSTGEFTETQVALIDRAGNKTQIWHDTQKLLSEIAKFSNTYMQFNDNWIGTVPILGSNNLAEDDMYYNNSFDCLLEPLTVNRLKGVKSVTATEDAIVGYLQDNEGNPGYMVVNYNDTTYKKKSDVVFTFANYSKAYVYIDGVKQNVTLKNNQLTLNLDIGEGVFVIPYVG